MDHLLDNPGWGALTTGNRRLAQGNDEVKYFDKEVSPFVGFKHNTLSHFQILYNILPHDGPVGFISTEPYVLPAMWQELQCIRCFQMIYNIKHAPQSTTALPVLLSEKHIPQMLALTKLTNPGPFAQRTIEFGNYYGFFEGDELVAMAGQRMHIGDHVEVSAVCTHPDHLGKGYARNLLLYNINQIIAAGNIPMLHVRYDNDRAVEVYKRVGFEVRREINFYIMKKAI